MYHLALLLPWVIAPQTFAPERSNGVARVQLVEFWSDTASYHVGSTLILGPTEAVLVDAQLRPRDADRVADGIVALHRC
jgi:hypothetical protein